MINSINLVAIKDQESAVLVKWRKTIKAITTVILAIWIVVCAGFLGWRVYVNAKTEIVSAELADLIAKITTKSKEEVIIRKVDARAKSVNEFLDQKGDVLAKLDVLLVATPAAESWKYERLGDSQIIQIKTDTVNELDDYISVLSQKYANVRVLSVNKNNIDNVNSWTIGVSIGGLIK